jgi:hypothetical protein
MEVPNEIKNQTIAPAKEEIGLDASSRNPRTSPSVPWRARARQEKITTPSSQPGWSQSQKD